EIAHCLGVVGRVSFCFAHLGHLLKRGLGPCAGDFSRLLDCAKGDVRQVLAESGLVLDDIFHRLGVDRECTHHVFHHRVHVCCLGHVINPLIEERDNPVCSASTINIDAASQHFKDLLCSAAIINQATDLASLLAHCT